MNHSSRRINHLANALSARTYLEIGVEDGNTFQNVDIATRTAVDPRFRFDYESQRNERTHFHLLESDRYFAERHNGELFDLIFIDGLHKFEQVVRDLSNAVVYSHSKSAIILDDTMASDVYSALPAMKDMARFRRLAKDTGGAWHGDTFKIVFYIHDFWPSLNYRTMVGSGNPQTLVWRSNKFVRKPRFDSLESISRMSYFDMVDNKDMFMECSEAEALELCRKELLD